jgi:hypothetical protein
LAIIWPRIALRLSAWKPAESNVGSFHDLDVGANPGVPLFLTSPWPPRIVLM